MADEHSVQDTVMKVLKEHPMCFPLRVTNVTGVPDVVANIGGRFAVIEVKDDKHGSYGVTKGQRIRLIKIRRQGGVACVVDRNNVDGFAEFVDNVVREQGCSPCSYGMEE